MKTHLEKSEISGIIFKMVIICLFGLTTLNETYCQIRKINHYDYLMPAKGKSMLELYSGIPYLAIGQYSYGFSSRFSVGIFCGRTPAVVGIGLRIKSVIVQPSNSMRVIFKSPLVYYPKMKGLDSWVLAWPSLNVEWKLKNEARVWTGVGVIGAACTEYLFGSKMKKTVSDPENPSAGPGMKKEPMSELWNSIQFGYSKPISNKCSYVIEVAPLMKGFKFATPHGLVHDLPAIVTLGLSFSL
jgi:hypothetical protein